jgi:hypothetical protein
MDIFITSGVKNVKKQFVSLHEFNGPSDSGIQNISSLKLNKFFTLSIAGCTLNLRLVKPWATLFFI